jgi:hypothetical protein
MAHSGGFEPPTARFVAEYSIQLSYECVRPRNILKWLRRVKSKSHFGYVAEAFVAYCHDLN